MKNILFLMGREISHISPVKPIIKYLTDKNYHVTVMTDIKFKNEFEKTGVEFQQYIFNFFEEKHFEIQKDYEIKAIEEMKKKQYENGFVNLMKKDAISVHYIENDLLKKLETYLLNNNIDIIFRDSIETYGYIISKKLKIKTIGYVTNNLYNENFFQTNPILLYKHFLGLANSSHMFSDYFFKNHSNIIKQVYYEVEQNHQLYPIPVYNQLDSQENFNIIFSTDFLQPKYFDKNKYKIFNPSVDKFQINYNNIDNKYITFFQKYSKIIYISTGSFLSANIEFYNYFIDKYKNTSYGIIISTGNNTKIPSKLYKPDNFLIESYVPQNYILKHSMIFISAGGFNSILESIYYNTPMIINPISPEQRLNGLLVEQLGIGYTLYKERNDEIDLDYLINQISKDSYIHNKLYHYSNCLKNSNNKSTLDSLIDYIEK